MIAQLKWLKEHAERNDLPLPVDPSKLSTLRYVYVDSLLMHHASSPAKADDEIEKPMVRLWKLTYKGQLLLKHEYYPYAFRVIDAVIGLLKHPPQPLDPHEQGAIKELADLRSGIASGTIQPPVGAEFPRYPHIGTAFGMERSAIRNMLGNKSLIDTAFDLIFQGTRPDTWLTPADADRETAKLVTSG